MDITSVVLVIVGLIMLTAALATWLLLRKEEVREETQAGPGGQPFLAPAIAEKTPPGPDQFEKEIISQVSEPDPLAGLEAGLAPYGPQGEPGSVALGQSAQGTGGGVPTHETKAPPKPFFCQRCNIDFKTFQALGSHLAHSKNHRKHIRKVKKVKKPKEKQKQEVDGNGE